MREHRTPYAQLSDEAKKRSNASAYLRVYLRRGKIVPATECFVCERPGKLEAHHPDYDKPLEVLWMHQACHREHHRLLKRM